MDITQVNYYDTHGGAAQICWYLFHQYRRLGHSSRLLVGQKKSTDPDVLEIPNDDYRNLWARVWNKAEKTFDLKWNLRLLPGGARLLAALGEINRWKDRQRGIEDFHFPATWHLLQLTPRRPDILHLHNLHGNYSFFDLRTLPNLSNEIPTIITLHDEWTMTGHCAYAINCERWRIGCGQCPDLSIYPSVKRDATAYNWERKKHLYERSRLYIASPSQWLLDRVNASIVHRAAVESRVIYHGIDLSVFQPQDPQFARKALDLPGDAWIGLFVGYGTRSNVFKDYATIEKAFFRFAAQSRERNKILICVGEEGPDQRIGSALIRFVGFQTDQARLRKYYCAADVCLHAARSEVWGLVVTEALACGTPVIGTSVGGVPEQIEEGVTGFLVPAGDSEAMAARLADLEMKRDLREQMGRNATETARKRFGLERMGNDYLNWYHEILERNKETR